MDATHCHICNEQGASAGKAGIAELSVNGALLIVGYLELTHDATIGYLHHYHLGGFAILHKHHMMATDGLDGVYLGSLGGSILPHGLTFLASLRPHHTDGPRGYDHWSSARHRLSHHASDGHCNSTSLVRL